MRGRAGFSTIPEGISSVRADHTAAGQKITVLCNFIPVEPLQNRTIYQYRVDFEPNVESVELRRRIFRLNTAHIFQTKCIFDGMNDARCTSKLDDDITTIEATDPREARRKRMLLEQESPGNEKKRQKTTGEDEEFAKVKIIIKNTGVIDNNYEFLRLYNLHLKSFLRILGFYEASKTGHMINPMMDTPIGSNRELVAVRGFRTAASVHENDVVLMNFETCHKLLQCQNVLQYMVSLKRHPDFIEVIKNNLRGKLVITSYNKVIYRIEEVDFSKNPMKTFLDRKNNRETTYKDYFQSKWSQRVTDLKQPLLLAVMNNKRRRGDQNEEPTDIYLIPELCNITGLTDEQKADGKTRMDLVRASQISPADRVEELQRFLCELHNNQQVKGCLSQWGYNYGKDPLTIGARILPTEKIGIGRAVDLVNPNWQSVNPKDANFDTLVMREKCAVIPSLPKLKIIIGQRDFKSQAVILGRIKQGFEKVGLNPAKPEIIRIEGNDTAQAYAQQVKRLPDDTTAAIVILPNQNKERYDAIKKAASVEKGLITQVVTSRLMLDERKASGASVKIGVQVVAKLGGEPWHINLPMADAMVCGYDTYHDTTKRGRSFGAFIASMNNRYSKWFSKADMHEHQDELSNHMAENLKLSMKRYNQINNKYPGRLFIYRDGVGDGQLEHVFNTELKQLIKAVKETDDKIRLSIIIVNKRIGARFYWKNGTIMTNCPPGSVIDDVVTRKDRYDFYLISQSTRQGTVSPTYYNIVYDECGLDASKHQTLAFKMCFNYYNWTGTVKVPAPCQYAHKLALLCGEHLHYVPNIILDDRLHFL